MNLRLGRFGLQESAAAVGLAALISGTFTLNVGETFARGNVCYMATAAGALLSFLLLRLLNGAMARSGEGELSEGLRGGLWPVLALPLVLGLVLSAACPCFASPWPWSDTSSWRRTMCPSPCTSCGCFCCWSSGAWNASPAWQSSCAFPGHWPC